MLNRLLTCSALAASLALVPACGQAPGNDHGHDHDDHADHAHAFEGVTKAICVLSPTNNAELPGVTGTITFTQTDHGLRVVANVSGLKPNAKHGFHVHQYGDISGADGTATGGHFNPGDSEHGLPTSQTHGDHEHHMPGGHVGDLGNLESDADGNAAYDKTFEGISLVQPGTEILGRAIIVHLGEDKGASEQPTGGAGPRVAQGVIGVAK